MPEDSDDGDEIALSRPEARQDRFRLHMGRCRRFTERLRKLDRGPGAASDGTSEATYSNDVFWRYESGTAAGRWREFQ